MHFKLQIAASGRFGSRIYFDSLQFGSEQEHSNRRTQLCKVAHSSGFPDIADHGHTFCSKRKREVRFPRVNVNPNHSLTYVCGSQFTTCGSPKLPLTRYRLPTNPTDGPPDSKEWNPTRSGETGSAVEYCNPTFTVCHAAMEKRQEQITQDAYSYADQRDCTDCLPFGIWLLRFSCLPDSIENHVSDRCSEIRGSFVRGRASLPVARESATSFDRRSDCNGTRSTH